MACALPGRCWSGAPTPRRLGAKTLFATHYHELTELENTLPGVKNFNIAARKRKDEILFLRKIVPGGRPELRHRGGQPGGPPQTHPPGPGDSPGTGESGSRPQAPPRAREAKQVSLTALGGRRSWPPCAKTPVENLTPIQALNLLYELKGKL